MTIRAITIQATSTYIVHTVMAYICTTGVCRHVYRHVPALLECQHLLVPALVGTAWCQHCLGASRLVPAPTTFHQKMATGLDFRCVWTCARVRMCVDMTDTGPVSYTASPAEFMPRMVMACLVMANTAMAYIVVADVGMAYMVMASCMLVCVHDIFRQIKWDCGNGMAYAALMVCVFLAYMCIYGLYSNGPCRYGLL